VGAGLGPGDPSLVRAGLDVQLLPPNIVWGLGRVHGSGDGDA